MEYQFFRNLEVLQRELKGRKAGSVEPKEVEIDPLVRGATDFKRVVPESNRSQENPRKVQTESDCDTPDGIVLRDSIGRKRFSDIDDPTPQTRSNRDREATFGFIEQEGSNNLGFLD